MINHEEHVAPEYHPTEIAGIRATEEDASIFRARSPFEWQADAMTMLAFAAAGVTVPELLARRASEIMCAADDVVGSADEHSPLGPHQIAAAQIAGRIISNLAELGHITIED